MNFQSKHIRGAARGKGLGFPTINLEVPELFNLETGIYAVWVEFEGHKFPGAMHFGPIPSFGDLKNNLEIYILDETYRGSAELIKELVTVAVVKRLRDVKKFDDITALQTQIEKDVEQVRTVLEINT